MSVILILSIISNPLDWGLSHIINTSLNYFSYFNSPGYQIIEIIERIECFPHTKLRIPDPRILNN